MKIQPRSTPRSASAAAMAPDLVLFQLGRWILHLFPYSVSKSILFSAACVSRHWALVLLPLLWSDIRFEAKSGVKAMRVFTDLTEKNIFGQCDPSKEPRSLLPYGRFVKRVRFLGKSKDYMVSRVLPLFVNAEAIQCQFMQPFRTPFLNSLLALAMPRLAELELKWLKMDVAKSERSIQLNSVTASSLAREWDLRVLKVTGCPKFDDAVARLWIQQAAHITDLDLSLCSLTASGLAYAAQQLGHQLLRFTFRSRAEGESILEQHIVHFVTACPRLEVFTIESRIWSFALILPALAEACPRLTTVFMTSCFSMDQRLFESRNVVSLLRRLLHLTAMNSSFSDVALRSIARNATALQKLTVIPYSLPGEDAAMLPMLSFDSDAVLDLGIHLTKLRSLTLTLRGFITVEDDADEYGFQPGIAPGDLDGGQERSLTIARSIASLVYVVLRSKSLEQVHLVYGETVSSLWVLQYLETGVLPSEIISSFDWRPIEKWVAAIQKGKFNDVVHSGHFRADRIRAVTKKQFPQLWSLAEAGDWPGFVVQWEGFYNHFWVLLDSSVRHYATTKTQKQFLANPLVMG
ncbi:uncharacterized protein BJ171DRAFT_262937 [Polychytrium aggregatum]|uniref:uncharacterized protein n=1 Tax=Polychytrium aggregatum TaxID=110093 RepID=UPI0022FE5A02|nr:uncharacterized protein BJ171DRAFT_262937 [Polychytrium aggregatum]KAI9193481.1 hypothetical protein BJ171DRAFT_262937 [Polychytrium aggregatum]